MKKTLLHIVLIGILLSFQYGKLNAQNRLTIEEKANLYIEVLKDSLFSRQLSRYFSYTENEGGIQQELNFLSIKKSLVKGSAQLTIDYNGLIKADRGVVKDLSIVYAINDFDKELTIGSNENIEGESFERYNNYLRDVFNNAPYVELENEDKRNAYGEKIKQVVSPQMSFENKINIAKGVEEYKDDEVIQLLKVVNELYEDYIDEESTRIYTSLVGDQARRFRNLYIEAGDKNVIGQGIFSREFSYESEHGHLSSFNFPIKDSIKVMPFMHIRGWGLNKKHQTTLVIKRGKKRYLLYSDTAALGFQCDTSFSTGKTYWDIKDNLENKLIPDLEDQINDKKGLKHWEKYYRNTQKNLLVDIRKSESRLRDYRRDRDKYEKKLKVEQEVFLQLSHQMPTAKKYYKEAQDKLNEARVKVTNYYFLLRQLNDYIGSKPVSFKEKSEGQFEFKDGSIFNVATQNLSMSPDSKNKYFSVRLVIIDESVLIGLVDENKVSITLFD